MENLFFLRFLKGSMKILFNLLDQAVSSIMRLNPGFLSLPVEILELDSSFNEAKLTVSNLTVVNDGAERGVKLCHDQQATSSRRVSHRIFCR